jgi:branched-chain amino acid transport system permease protein
MDAVAVGSLYALIALGYTMVYGILKFINFAHSDVFTLGAWVSLTAATAAGFGAGGESAPIAGWVHGIAVGLVVAAVVMQGYERLVRGRLPDRVTRRLPGPGTAGVLTLMAAWALASLGLVYVARSMHGVPALRVPAGGVILLTAMLVCGLVGFTIERLAYKPLRRAPRLNVLITAIGVSLLLQNVGQLDWMFGPRPQPMPMLIPSDTPLATIAGVNVWLVDVIGAGTAVALMVALDWLVFRTKLGRAMRAVSFSPANASLMGIPVDRVVSFTFVLGSMLAAAAGFLYGQKYPAGIQQTAAATWVLLGLKAFVAAVVGGIGNIRGAMAGGLLIGLLEFFGAAYIDPALKDVYVFTLLIVVLLVRPSGLLGKAVAEKV